MAPHRVSLLCTTALCLAFVSCAKAPQQDALHLTKQAAITVGCEPFSDEFFDGLYRFVSNGKSLPSANDFESALERSMNHERLNQLQPADRVRLRELMGELYEIVLIGAPPIARASGDTEMQVIAALELGDRTEPERTALTDRFKAKLREIEAFTSELEKSGELHCPRVVEATPKNEPAPLRETLFEQWKTARHPAVYGGLKAIATSYQSCSAATLPAIKTATPDVLGITEVGMHTDGIGSKREITDLAALIRTHPYLKNYKKPRGGSNCFDIKKKPLIYDYGGRPWTDAASYDFFKDEGSGTAELGFDCSAYVYVAFATAGLKLKPSGRLKASDVQGARSAQFMDPGRTSDLTCLAHASFSKTASLKPGDVVAKRGHVFIIDTVGSDPFGIRDIESSSGCKLENMSLDRFDFTILQSSNDKKGIGIHRAEASSFLKTTDMGQGMLVHAVNACKARFGLTTRSRVSSVAITRHKGTSACRDTAIAMERESCVASCPAQ
ncbi:MAG TPA: hypothetical protein VM432_14635 [Bdellovibrionales bacterium]|nr:hypothetical protein [Bdellovibrionales bacterium]